MNLFPPMHWFGIFVHHRGRGGTVEGVDMLITCRTAILVQRMPFGAPSWLRDEDGGYNLASSLFFLPAYYLPNDTMESKLLLEVTVLFSHVNFSPLACGS